MNIVGNAIKYTTHGYIFVHVKFGVQEEDQLNQNNTNNSQWQRIIFSVRDTGIGIPPENINKLFKLFGQVKSAHKVNQNGSGLGLAVCKCLIE